MQSLKEMKSWYDRYMVGKQAEALPYDIIEEGLADEDSTVRAAFMRRKDFNISQNQVEVALKDDSSMVKIALIHRSDVVFSEEQKVLLP